MSFGGKVFSVCMILGIIVLGLLMGNTSKDQVAKLPQKEGDWNCQVRNYAVTVSDVPVFSSPDAQFPYLVLKPGNLVEIMDQQDKQEAGLNFVTWLRLDERKLGIPDGQAWVKETDGVSRLPCVPKESPYMVPPA